MMGAQPSTRSPLPDHYRARQSSADLLDLVRSAEEAAMVATSMPPDVQTRPEIEDQQAQGQQDFIDVGDDAVDALPSLTPPRVGTPVAAFAPVSVAAPSTSPVVKSRSVPPLMAALLVIALAVIALIAVTR